MPPAETMVGKKLSPKAKYHEHFAMLGKTSLGKDELKLLGTLQSKPHRRYENQIFLYEVSQPFDKDRERAAIYSKDISEYLGLSQPLDPIVPRTSKSRNYHYAIDICDDKYIQLRAELMEVGKNAAKWIVTYFLDLPDVYVSQRGRFEELLQTWYVDPCDSK